MANNTKIVSTIPRNSARLKLARFTSVTARGLETMRTNYHESTAYNGIGKRYANDGLTLIVGV